MKTLATLPLIAAAFLFATVVQAQQDVVHVAYCSAEPLGTLYVSEVFEWHDADSNITADSPDRLQPRWRDYVLERYDLARETTKVTCSFTSNLRRFANIAWSQHEESKQRLIRRAEGQGFPVVETEWVPDPVR
jgi:hypothetical protein